MVSDTIDDRRSKGPARKDYRIMYENGYKKLQDSLIDVIAEEQAKLGYMKEPIRLYYPLSSLHHFFESEGDAEAMQESLGGFPEATKEIFGEVQVSHKGDRFCFFLCKLYIILNFYSFNAKLCKHAAYEVNCLSCCLNRISVPLHIYLQFQSIFRKKSLTIITLSVL